MPRGRAPIRTCVGCRQRCPAAELLRVVVVDGAVVPDAERRMPGRGASVHLTSVCVNAAVRRRAFARALRQPVTDLGALSALVATAAPGHERSAGGHGADDGLDSTPNTVST